MAEELYPWRPMLASRFSVAGGVWSVLEQVRDVGEEGLGFVGGAVGPR